MFKFLASVLISGLLFSVQSASAQKKIERVSIGFYNLENLFDTENDTTINDEEFLPEGGMKWTQQKYENKLQHMAYAISKIGDNVKNGHPVIMGVSEIENRRVLEDLINTKPLSEQNWKIIHFNSPDRRGIDVALLYRSGYFIPTNIHPYPYHLVSKPNFRTRDQLLISGLLLDEKINIIVNHWPSRYGGELSSRPLRDSAAVLTRHITDSIMQDDPEAKIIIMGDLNDDPINESVQKYLNTTDNKKLEDGQLYNPMLTLFNKGLGSLAYRDQWNLFDQIIISPGLYKPKDNSFEFQKAFIYNEEFLRQQEGRYKGYPLRTHAGGAYLNGYSDHFPVFILLKRYIR
ncbi:endonuclease/exonuclease/phosphatase family protein [Saccharicrinis sp. FJH54]|uniref:endonuclease/exonuclease/phosphatase family protein n=1 Tax=Saccharicrinis sp. FJH54 TaxID=3344665 RepID=UPI0035D439F4